MNNNIILIDASYYIFYRVHAIVSWWQKAMKHESPIGIAHENNVFVEKFCKLFNSKLQELPKKLKIKNYTIFIAKDCPQRKIWRFNYHDSYKDNRIAQSISDDDSDILDIGMFFKMVYTNNMFEKAGYKILNCDKLEADDCIAITTKYITKTYPDTSVYIIGSDHDYFQLLYENVYMYNLAYKNLKKDNITPEEELFVKCVIGDKSDNIKGIFSRCGDKKARYYYQNQDEFFKILENDINASTRFKYNKRIIDFNSIPFELISNFYFTSLKPNLIETVLNQEHVLNF